MLPTSDPKPLKLGTIQTRQRKSDGLHAAWRYEPHVDRASPWICVAVAGTRDEVMSQARQTHPPQPSAAGR